MEKLRSGFRGALNKEKRWFLKIEEWSEYKVRTKVIYLLLSQSSCQGLFFRHV
jgi:hypothetical protein